MRKDVAWHPAAAGSCPSLEEELTLLKACFATEIYFLLQLRLSNFLLHLCPAWRWLMPALQSHTSLCCRLRSGGLQRGLPLCAASVFFLPRGRAGDAVDVTFLAADRRMSRLHLVTLLLKPGTPTSNGPGFLECSTAREAPAIFGAPCLEHGQLAISVGIYELCPEEGNEIYPGNQALQGITFPVLSSAQTARCLQVSVKSWFLIAFY